MTQTFIIYTILLVAFIAFPLLRNIISQNETIYYFKKEYLIYFIPVLIYAFIEGNRYKVGIDWEQYRDAYKCFQIGLEYNRTYEPLYTLLNKSLIFLGFGYPSLFILEGFLLIYSYSLIIKIYPKALLFALPLFLFLFYSDAENLSRQFLAISVMLIAVHYLINGSKITYFCISLVAFLIHFSAIFFIPIIYFVNDSKLLQPYIYFALYIIALIISETGIIYKVLDQLQFVYVLFNRETYFAAARFDYKWKLSLHAFIIQFLFVSGTIFLGPKVIKQYNDNRVNLFFSLSILSLIAMEMFRYHELLSRLFSYLRIFLPITWALIIYGNWKFKKSILYKLFFLSIFGYYLLYYYLNIYKQIYEGYIFRFWWDV